MNDYSANSKKPRDTSKESAEHERRVKPVTKASTKEKSQFRKFAQDYIHERTEDAKKYVFKEWLWPAIQDALSNVASILIFGEAGRLMLPKRGSTVVKRSYDKEFERNRTGTAQVGKPRQAFENEDIIFSTYGEAEYALEELRNAIAQYDIARVLDLYDTCQLTAPAGASNFGWTNLDNAKPVKSLAGDGYYLQLPRPMPID